MLINRLRIWLILATGKAMCFFVKKKKKKGNQKLKENKPYKYEAHYIVPDFQ